jgi:signal transduction histidine kinase
MRLARWAREALLIGAVLAVDLLVSALEAPVTRAGTHVPSAVFPVIAVVASVALVWRWSHPVAVFTGEWLYGMTSLVVPVWQPLAALLVALYAVARRPPARTALGYLAAALVPFAVDSFNGWDRADPRTVVDFLGPFLLFALLSMTVWGFARLMLSTERTAEAKAHLETEAALRSERLALARELHDIVAHSVSAMIMQAAGATTLVGDRDARIGQALEQIEKSGVQAMTELHRLLGLLRTVDDNHSGDTPDTMPGIDDIDTLLDASRAAGVDVRVRRSGIPLPVDPSVSLTAYRVVQEALTNAMRYSGRGAQTELALHWLPERLIVIVRDRGGLIGTAARTGVPSSGYGLVGLAERVKLVGGQLSHGPTSDGFLVEAELPIENATAGAGADGDGSFGAEDGT